MPPARPGLQGFVGSGGSFPLGIHGLSLPALAASLSPPAFVLVKLGALLVEFILSVFLS